MSPLGTAVFIPTRQQPCPRMRSRGVFLADVFDASGNPIVEAVTSSGRVVHTLPWAPDADLNQVMQLLRVTLDTLDPQQPRLTVIR